MPPRFYSFCVLLLVAGLTACNPAWTQEAIKSNSAEDLGRELFTEVWAPFDKRSPQGDGLGPMFNETSCAACHPQGGSSGRSHNVQLLSLRRTGADRNRSGELPEEVRKTIPFFETGGESTVILHKSSTDEFFNHQRRELFGLNPPPNIPKSRLRLWKNAQAKKHAKLPLTRVLKRFKNFELIISERNSPALFGGELIDNIQPKDLHAAALEQQRINDGISGRVSIASDGLIGKFGWRGQTSSLAGFVKGACAAELGLQSKEKKQSINPYKPNSFLDGVDMDLTQLDALTAFVESIPRPVFKRKEELSRLERRGREVFHRVDCAKCHIEDLGGVGGIYSDLLLHDMGRGLADPMPAMPEQRFFKSQHTFNDHGYFGAGSFTVVESRRQVTTNILREWQTPPLWGVADSAPYLHDGRAETLLDAIKLHAGEAESSLKKFAISPGRDQQALIAFLKSLTVK